MKLIRNLLEGFGALALELLSSIGSLFLMPLILGALLTVSLAVLFGPPIVAMFYIGASTWGQSIGAWAIALWIVLLTAWFPFGLMLGGLLLGEIKLWKRKRET